MKIAAFETEEWEASACRALQPEHEVTCTRDALDDETVTAYADAEAVTVFVHSRLTAPVLSALPRLKLIATRSTGFDHIDMTACATAGITVVNVPSYGDVTVAEHVFALLLGVARHLVAYSERARRGDFAQADLRGFELNGKTMGVVGTGRIGRRVIALASGFGMEVIAHDIRPDADLAKRLGFRYMDFQALLADADVVSLHMPASAETIGLFCEDAFARMKPGAILINTARGNIVDIEALVRALSSGHLRAAGLDVLPQEPLMRDEAEVFRGRPVTPSDLKALLANHVLMRTPNVLITPHIAYNTEEALRRIIETTVENIRSFSRGRPVNVVAG